MGNVERTNSLSTQKNVHAVDSYTNIDIKNEQLSVWMFLRDLITDGENAIQI